VLKNKSLYALILIIGAAFILLSACSNQKNTALTRAYHSINTRYNVHFNAQEAYNESLKAKLEGTKDNLSEIVYIYPVVQDEKSPLSDLETNKTAVSTTESVSNFLSSSSDSTNMQTGGGAFSVTIDKTTKAIKEHSIKVKPRRDASKRGDKKYQAWVKQQEFNPFLKNTWILLGKAELQNGDYLRSAATFSYISKIYSTNPEIITECQLWIARAYSEMGWFYEAENVLRKIDQRGAVPDNLQSLYSSVYANLAIRMDNYEKSIPYLQSAIQKEKNKRQKMRMEYLLGQVYAKTGKYQEAYDAFDKIPGMSTPYEFEFNARLQQMDLPGMNENNKILSDLNKMTKRSKNKEYLDQIYSAIGKNYLQHQDTVKAVENYKKAIKESTRNGYDKAIAQISLADIYFDKHDFIEAQPYYTEALSQITSENERYPRLSLRSAVLDELVVHVKTVHEQDSLQHLAQLPEAERLEIINQKIENLKKEEKEKEKEAEREKLREEREARASSWDDLMGGEDIFDALPTSQAQKPIQTTVGNNNEQGLFYFYNTNTVTQGKIGFQKQWGNRKLEDDWRRRNKRTSSFGDIFADNIDQQVSDSTQNITLQTDTSSITDTGNKKVIEDKYSVDYYLQQLPFTEAEVQASNVLIENALYNMGLIYKNNLQNFPLAIDAFTTDIRRFPQTPNLEDIYYQLFLIYMQIGNKDMMAQYRDKILAEFSSGIYAVALTDPNYEWNLKNMGTVQQKLYEETYQAYISGDIETVSKNYTEISTKYPFADLMPKFMLLNGLTYAQTKDAENLKTSLTKLVETYPKSDVAPLATNIVNRINSGQMLLSDGTPITGFDWSAAYAIESGQMEGDSIKQFVTDTEKGFILAFTFQKGTIDRNELLYHIANYNFSNYVVQTFDLGFDNAQTLEMLQVKGFNTFEDVKIYINRGFERELFSQIDPAVMVIPIALDNYNAFLLQGIDSYISFFEANYSEELPQLIALWNNEEIKPEKEEITPATDSKIEEKQVSEPEIPQKQEEAKEPERVIITDNDSDNDNKNKAVEQKTEEEIQQEIINEKIEENIQAAEELLSNPVDGIKNLIKKHQNKPKLTKEEKEAEKEQKRLEKEKQKQLKAIEKIRQDSIAKAEKALEDSIRNAEKLHQDSIKQAQKAKIEGQKRAEKEKKDAMEAAKNAREAEQKRKEEERKERQRAQQERIKEREKERKERERIQNERRKQKEKEEREKVKLREKERKEKQRTSP
jgi:tetratricopeptide (TPR) repeat protein